MFPTILQIHQVPFLAYSISHQDVTDSQSITLDPFCNSWTVINMGDVWVNVNGILLKGHPIGQPDLIGASLSATGNYGEIYKGLVNIQSAATTPGSGSTRMYCIIIQKTYNR